MINIYTIKRIFKLIYLNDFKFNLRSFIDIIKFIIIYNKRYKNIFNKYICSITMTEDNIFNMTFKYNNIKIIILFSELPKYLTIKNNIYNIIVGE